MHLVQTAFTTLHGCLSEATSRHHERQYWRTTATMLIAHIHRSILATIERSKTKPPKKIRSAKSVVESVWKNKQTNFTHTLPALPTILGFPGFFLFPFSFFFFIFLKQTSGLDPPWLYFLFLFSLFLFSFLNQASSSSSSPEFCFSISWARWTGDPPQEDFSQIWLQVREKFSIFSWNPVRRYVLVTCEGPIV